MKAPISLCIIVRDEEKNIEECLKSIRDYVEELIVVDTGSIDNTVEIVKKYADKFEIFTDCNDENGVIKDFSAARNYCFSLASKDWVMWADADDIIHGAENLKLIVEKYSIQQFKDKNISILFPYEYGHDANGNSSIVHYRERLVYPGKNYRWKGPVHEVLMSDNSIHEVLQDVKFIHRRGVYGKVTDPYRNFRIIKKLVDEIGESDARQLYYLGLEYGNIGEIDNAIKTLARYTELTGWEDEKFMAQLKIAQHYLSLNDFNNSIEWANKAIHNKEDWSEAYFHLGKTYYYLALSIEGQGKQARREWQKCVNFIKIGFSFPSTNTLLFVYPLERSVEIHRHLNMALGRIGDIVGALESCNVALKTYPNDPQILFNKLIFEKELHKNNAINELNQLGSLGSLNDWQKSEICNILYGKTKPIHDDWKQYNKPEGYPKNVTKNDFPIAAISPHSQAWSIPEQFVRDDLPLQMTDAQLQSMVSTIWHQYMLHDEVLSAISFLENAPYRVRHSFETQKALELTKACIAWMDDKNDFQKINAPANPEVEAGNPLPNKLVMSEGHRFDYVANNLQPNSTLVDFGCMDGCFTNRYGMLCHKPTGLDVCESSIKLARKKAIEFDTGAEYVCTYFQDAVDKVPNNHFDYATSTDTYEHIKDPVKDMFVPAKKMLKEDGKFLLATPHGAWMRGQYLEWAHPWAWAREGKSWITPSPRAHLVAPTVWTLAAQFREAGYWVKDCYPDMCDNTLDLLSQEVIDQGNIFAEAHKQPPSGYEKGLDVVFFIGDGLESWTPKSVEKTGVGGSELMAIEMAKRLAALGHKVRIYNSCGFSGEGIYDGVEYRMTDKFQDLECDVLFVSRFANYLGDQYNIKSKLKLLWVHDVTPISYTNELLLKADKILCLSEWHKQNVIDNCNVHPDHILVTRNGIDLSLFENKNIKRNKFKCVTASSPDRSLPVLLDIWSKIKEKVPSAELHIYYGFHNWKIFSQNDPLQMDLINRLECQIKSMENLGVVYHGRINQNKLAEEFLSSGTLLHPTWFSETYGITFANAQAAGVRIVSSSIGALNEVVADRGTLIDGSWTDESYQNEFIDASVRALLKEDDSDRQALQNYAKDNFGLNELAKEWEQMFFDLMKEKETNPIIPYNPTPAYRDVGKGYSDGDTRLEENDPKRNSL